MSSSISNKIFEKLKEVKKIAISPTPGFKTCAIMYGLIFFFTLLTAISIYNVSTDTNILNSDKYIYTFVSFIPLVLLIAASFFIFNKDIKIFNLIIGLSIVGIVFIFFYYFNKIISFGKKYGIFFNIILQIIIFSIILTGLAIVFTLFEKKLRSLTGLSGVIVNLIFLIPCLFTDFLKYLKEQLNITPSITFILLIIEFILIILYLFIPYLFNAKIMQGTGKPLLKESLFLNTKTDIAKTSDLDPIKPKEFGGSVDISEQSTDMFENKNIRRNYTFSMWIYLNEQPSFSNEKTIFNYGSSCPRISYTNNNNNNNNNTNDSIMERINILVNTDTVYNFEIPRQKWNYIVFNYDNGSVDIFINGTLERTVFFYGNPPRYNDVDLVSVGDESGVNGAICNIEYYSVPLTQLQITTKYNLLINKNPPLNY
jgi:hypothetical protein